MLPSGSSVNKYGKGRSARCKCVVLRGDNSSSRVCHGKPITIYSNLKLVKRLKQALINYIKISNVARLIL